MQVPLLLVNSFKNDFEAILTDFLVQSKAIEAPEMLQQKRFIGRSIAPHVQALSELFNRIEGSQTDGIDSETYWTSGGNPKNRRLAYFLSFMPCNLFRVASVWTELARLGFSWPHQSPFRALEWGAGVASGACGILAGERASPLGLPEQGSFALIEQSKTALTMGTNWFTHFSKASNFSYDPRAFHRRLDLSKTWLPRSAPVFQLFVMSYFLNECGSTPESYLDSFIEVCEKHLEEEGLVIIVEPALKLQSRKLLHFRKLLLDHPRIKKGDVPLQVLLPCLGHQACGALAKEDDWCHEEVSWWRPSYLRELDSLTGLDRKSLPFSYLVIQKTKKPLQEILPRLSGPQAQRFRLVSPSHELSKKTSEFYICGQDGKRRARYQPQDADEMPNRGDILNEVEMHGEAALTQIDRAKLLKNDGKN